MNEYSLIRDTKPLIHCSPKIIKEEILVFLQIFQKAPLCFHRSVSQINIGDLFWIYYTLKKYNPSVVIENNGIIGDGLSWLVSKVCPISRIISLCNDVNNEPYINMNLKNTYIQTNFIDINWSQKLGLIDCTTTLVISPKLEDHHAIASHAYNHKIPYIIFTNNYPTTQGSFLTIKKILSHNYHISRNNSVVDFHYIPNSYKTHILNMYEYFEFPPVYKDRQVTRWNDYFSEHGCKDPIFEKEDDYLSSFIEYQLSYTFICFLKLK